MPKTIFPAPPILHAAWLRRVETVGQLLKDEVIEGDALIELAEAVTHADITDDSPSPESTEQEMAA